MKDSDPKWLRFSLIVTMMSFVHVADTRADFVRNIGQEDSQVAFSARGFASSVYLTSTAIVVDLRGGASEDGGRRAHAIYLRFEGANRAPTILSRGETSTRYNFFLGDDSARWASDLPGWREVVYGNLWPGVDLVVRQGPDAVDYDLVADDEAALRAVRFAYEGAERIVAGVGGATLIGTSLGNFVHQATPSGGYLSTPARQSVDVPTRDNPASLVWGTYLGSYGSYEVPTVVRLDAGGDLLVAGETDNGFPTTPGAYDVVLNGGHEGFVAKLSSSGSALIWGTYLGGLGNDHVYDLAIDSSGNVVLAGATTSANFPTTVGAYDRYHNGGLDAFVAKLSSSGSSLLWSTYLGGASSDDARGLALDASDNALLTGYTDSPLFPTVNAYEASHNGGRDAFVAKLNSSGAVLLGSTFLGTSEYDQGLDLCLDFGGNPVVVGETFGSNFPILIGYDGTYNGGRDVFVISVLASCSSVLWGSFLGGSGQDEVTGVCRDSYFGYVVTGVTTSADLPTTAGAFDRTYGGASLEDGFVAKLSLLGDALVWGTYLGGSGYDRVSGLALDVQGNALLAGRTRSADYPTTANAFDTSLDGYNDAVISVMNADGSGLRWSTYLGGWADEEAWGLAPSADGDLVVVGTTSSADFPVTNGAFDTVIDGLAVVDAFVTRFHLGGSTGLVDDGLPEATDLTAYPNPFNPRTTVNFKLPAAGHATVAIYDARGMAVAMLVDDSMAAGAHALSWDGRGAHGGSMPSGTYFCRLTTSEGVETQKLQLIR